MPVNASFVGRTYPPTAPYAVGRAKIAEFAEAVGAVDAVHTDPELARSRGYADVIAPPTFAVLIAQRCDKQLIVDPEAGIDYTRVVHGEQRFVHHRPIAAGDEIVAVLTVDSVRQAGGHAMVTTRSELATVAGEAVCTAVSTLVIRGGVMPEIRTAAGTRVGDALPGRIVHVERATLVQYAGASLDRNRIHWDERFALSVGLPDVIAHGMFTMGAVVQVVVDWVGDAGRIVEYSTRFTRPVVVDYGTGADIEVSAVVKALDAETRRATVEITAVCAGAKVLGRAVAVVALD